MKKLALFFLTLLCGFNARATGGGENPPMSVEYIGGGLTYHVRDDGASQYYSNKIADNGKLIANLVYGFGLTLYDKDRDYFTFRYFQGNNSIGKPIHGGTFSCGYAFKNLELGFILGGYIQNDYDFDDTNVVPFSLNKGSNAVVPLVGLEINPKVNISKVVFIKMNNVLTPVITNHSLSLGFNL